MLGKLIKYEFKATGRMLLPLYGALIILAFVNKIFVGDFFTNTDTFLRGIPKVIAMVVYIGIMIATFIATLLIIIQRYRINLLGDEGYLMNTLPVKSWHNITSKLIVATVWSILSVVVSVVSIVVIAYYKGMFSDIVSSVPQFITEFSAVMEEFQIMTHPSLMWVSLGIMAILSPIYLNLLVYASLSIGNLFQKRKVLASFGSFVVLNIAINTVTSMIQMPFLGLYTGDYVNEPLPTIIGLGIFDLNFILSVILSLIVAVGLFVTSNYILTKQLNLD